MRSLDNHFDRDDEPRRLPRGIWWAVAGLVALFVIGLVISFFILRARAKTVVAAQAGSLETGVNALQNFDFAGAASAFQGAASSSANFQAASNIFSLFTHGQNPVASLTDLASRFSSLSHTMSAAEDDGVTFLSGAASSSTNQGNLNLANDAAALQSDFHAIDGDTASLASLFSIAGTALPGGTDFVGLQTKLRSAESFLDAFVPWFSDPSPHHVLVLFQNSSELRPTGGFLGSYADVTIANGTIQQISMHDVSDVDDGFTQKIVPPVPLQLEVTSMRPADTNWFFDFPTSASETISYFEQSSLYAASGTKFDGVIALTPQVIGDLLSVTGPVTVSSTKTIFTADDFMQQVQAIVQAGQAAQKGSAAAKYPKHILADLGTQVLAQFASSTSDQRKQLFSLAAQWITDKDVQAYFTNPAFENFLTAYGAGGDVYDLPQNFEGDYLAITGTNINGQKSDLYVHENITWQSEIGNDGTVTDNLSISRMHTATSGDSWWYDAPNQSYVQLFVPVPTALTNESGGVVRTIPAPTNYAKGGYVFDPLIAALQSSTQAIVGIPGATIHEESGKNVFAVWSRVSPGASTTLSFDYTHRLYLPIVDGTSYQFIFEKQAGTNRSYNFEIDAPLGYVFAETGLAAWTYTSDDPPARLVVNLTLTKI